ncbi:MAG: DNA polymerase I [Myxococcota bacterium]|nr:DNA polymerase I [Myxococcota bacterium]
MSPKSEKGQAAGRRRLVVIDGANTLYRAFFAIPGLRASDGTPTNAALGFTNMLTKVLREESPDFAAVTFDPRGGSFRNRLYPGYKANRDAQPEDLSTQFPLVREIVKASGVALLEVDDFEADDVIATLVAQAPEDVAVTIVSTDKDLMQLVSDRVELADGMKDRRYGPAEVEERFGVGPEQMLDLRSLVGDPSDNIPGVKGIGAKGAAKLIGEWGTLENLLEHAGEVTAKRARTALEEHADDARLSKELSSLRFDVPIPLDFDELALGEPEVAVLRPLFERLGFTRQIAALDEAAGAGGAPAKAPAQSRMDSLSVETVESKQDLRRALAALDPATPMALCPVGGEGSVGDAPWVGFAFCQGTGQAVYVPIRGEGQLLGTGMPPEEAAAELERAFGEGKKRSKAPPWLGPGMKVFQAVLEGFGARLRPPACDIELAAFLVDPAGPKTLSSIAPAFGVGALPGWEDLAGRGAKQVPAADLAVPDVAQWAAAQACAAWALRSPLVERLEADGLFALFEEVEMPLTRVLGEMERAGVRIDEGRLAELSEEYRAELERLEAEIYRLAGEKFLVSSPKQLQVILFEKLKLPVIKKTKTGYSTAEGVLEQLAAHHELPGVILAWRRLAKLKSTYIDALPALVSERTGRIHPTFHQTGAATGRLSASNPNVQNIPIRTEEGIRIREAFVPAEGCELVSADYSQVELRILAHYSADESLIDAFQQGEDIHRRTAAEVAGIEVDEVTGEQRARAKAVNFGIIYGSTAFGLANQLGIATPEAQETIDAYFERYRGVRRFLDETMAEAKSCGYVTTLLGRRRYLPDLGSRNRVLRQAAERMAVNTVIQGSEADLIKRAMVAVHEALGEGGLRSKLVLQVHDELVFESPHAEVEALSGLARECMQGVYSLSVPLEVDLGTGANWREAH